MKLLTITVIRVLLHSKMNIKITLKKRNSQILPLNMDTITISFEGLGSSTDYFLISLSVKFSNCKTQNSICRLLMNIL